MPLIWDDKNNFILAHSIAEHEQRSTTSPINWSAIVDDIRLEICTSPELLQSQYEHLLTTFRPGRQPESLYATVKQIYLGSLCERIENDLQMTLETVYEFVRHARSGRIHERDIERLLNEWNCKCASDGEQKNRERLFQVLNRLRHYIQTLSTTTDPFVFPIQSEPVDRVDHLTIQPTVEDSDLQPVSDSDNDEKSPVIHVDRFEPDVAQKEKPALTRRRTRSLTHSSESKDNGVNIDVEWFVPKLKRQQRSTSLHTRCPSSPATETSSSSNTRLPSNGILLTTVDNDESSNSTDPTNVGHTNAQPSPPWLPATAELIADEEHLLAESKSIEDAQLDQVSSTDSESVEIQWSSSSADRTGESSRSHDLNEGQRENSAVKRQRLA